MVSHGAAADLSGEPLDNACCASSVALDGHQGGVPRFQLVELPHLRPGLAPLPYARGNFWRNGQPSNIGNTGPHTLLGEAALHAKGVASGVGRGHVPGHPDDSGEWGNGPWSAGVNVAPATAVEMTDEQWSVAVMNDALVNARLEIVVGGDQYVCCGPLLCPCLLS